MKNAHLSNTSLGKSSIQLFLSSSIDTKVAKIAQEVITNLFLLARKNNLTWIDPRITANNSAGIGFEWWENGRFFALSVNSDRSIDFVKGCGPEDPSRKWESSTLRKIKIGQEPSKRELLTTWKWLTATLWRN